MSPVTKLIKGHILYKLMSLQKEEVPKLLKTDLSKALRYAEKARKTAQKHIFERARNNPQPVNLVNITRGRNATGNSQNDPGSTSTGNRFYI